MSVMANVAFGPAGQESDLGDHEFVILPRVGEQFLTYIGEDISPVTVDAVFHYPRRPGGPQREPLVVLRVSMPRPT